MTPFLRYIINYKVAIIILFCYIYIGDSNEQSIN